MDVFVFFSLPSLGIDLLIGADPYPATAGGWWRLWLDELEGVVWPVCAAWMVANAPWLLGFRLVAPAKNLDSPSLPEHDAATEPSPEPETPPFAKLVHPSAWGTLLYLKAELQYIRVVTDKGESLILYSLRDAISELPPQSGMQIHRSYWVARRVVRQLHVQGRQGVVELDNGVKLPVSRGNIKQVKQAMAT